MYTPPNKNKCAVSSCENTRNWRKKGDVLFHSFPQDARLQQWLEAADNININKKNYKSYKICSNHFEVKYQLSGNRLTLNALPTLHTTRNRRCDAYDINVTTTFPIQERITPQASTSKPRCEPATTYQTSNEDVKTKDDEGSSTSNLTSKSSKKNSKSILRQVGVKRRLELSRTERFLHSHLVYCRKMLQRARKENVQGRLEILKIINGKQLESRLNVAQQTFISSQLRNLNYPKIGKKFTNDEKLLSVFFWKTSPICYQLLSSVFSLPSPSTLHSFLSKISFSPGICKPIFNSLRQFAILMRPRDRVCTLIFDEIGLLPHLNYNLHRDVVVGFANDGINQTGYIANHAQVWMLRGVHKNWKQPVAYTFCKDPSSASDIIRMYKAIVKHATACGFEVVASISDQSFTNCSAIRNLLEESRANALRKGEEFVEGVICVGDHKIIHLYDPPHLLKCIRNNFLVKDLQFSLNGTQCRATWSDIKKAYFMDKGRGFFRSCPKLTDFHILPSKIRKMKVSYCAQVFSQSLSSWLNSLIMINSSDPALQLSPNARGTCLLLQFFDQLFDSVNGGWKSYRLGKPLSRAFSPFSDHLEFWNNALQVLESMSFVTTRPNLRTRPVTLQNWMFTLRGFTILKNRLEDFGIRTFAPKCFNRDPLDNFFGQLRQHGASNVNPSSSAFANYFKTLVIRNSVKVNSKAANCQEDNACILLNSWSGFLEESEIEADTSSPWTPPVLPDVGIEFDEIDVNKLTYVADYIARTLLKSVSGCIVCQNTVLNEGQIHSIRRLVRSKEYRNHCLTYINPTFASFIIQIYSLLHFILPKVIYLPNVVHKCKLFINMHCSSPLNPCPNHPNMVDDFIKSFSKLLLYRYIRTVNNIILGKDCVKPSDSIQKQAKAFSSRL